MKKKNNATTLVIDEIAYSFKMGNWQIAQIEEKFDKSIFEIINTGMAMRYIIGILWIGLKDSGMVKNEMECSELINPGNLLFLTTELGKIVMNTLVDIPVGDKKDDEKGN